MEDRLYWLGWQYLMPGAGKRLWSLVEHFGSPRAAWEAGIKDLSVISGLGGDRATGLAERRSRLDPQQEAGKLDSMGVSYVCHSDPAYPENLLGIYDPPPVIFYKGQLKATDKLSVAIVGTRKPSPYGLVVAEKLAKDLTALGITITSGMARGIDSAAHRGALAEGGRTIAVLGCGPDVVYPKENKQLMEAIIDNGAVVSEFPPGTQPEAWRFPVRNRIISGLSQATLVVEAAERSGALITADFALEQGRDVMAVPGNVVNPLSRGPHRLIKQGARLIEGAGDVLDELGMEKLFPIQDNTSAGKMKMSCEEETLYGLLSLDPVSLDELITRSNLLPQKAMAALMYLEIKGLTRQLPGKFYIRTGRDFVLNSFSRG
ncbi:MAG: DNA-processing protein DprA [Desulfotomaculaceae bacterium]|nr:DNA-processing protein DprA [Desulfotomaculaceae bacterium]